MKHMQLKKRFSVRKGVAAGAMAVAMFATSMPALASNGAGIGIGISGHSDPNHGKLERNFRHGDSKARQAYKDDLQGLRALKKEVRDDLKSAWKGQRNDRDASNTAQSAAIKQCRKTAKDAYSDAASKAREERDSGLKSAVDTYKAALKSAQSAFQATVDAGSGLDVTAAARLTYRTAISDAHKAFRSAKISVLAAYRTEIEAARKAEKEAKDSCLL
jgi:hypothetical protein